MHGSFRDALFHLDRAYAAFGGADIDVGVPRPSQETAAAAQ